MNSMNEATPAGGLKKHWYIDGMLLLVALAWGTTYLGSKEVLRTESIATLLALRFGLATLLLVPFVLKSLMRIRARDFANGTILGLLLSLSIGIETLGISLTSPANAGILIAMTIIFVPVIESFVFRGFQGRRLLAPACVSVLGCALLTMHGGFLPNAGDLLILLSAVTRAVHLVISRKLGQDSAEHGVALSAIQFAMVALAAFLLAIGSGDLANDVPNISGQNWLILLYLAGFCTTFAFLAQLIAVRMTSASRVGLLLGTEPIFAALIAVLVGGEHLPLLGWFGGAMIVAATYWGRAILDRPAQGAATQ